MLDVRAPAALPNSGRRATYLTYLPYQPEAPSLSFTFQLHLCLFFPILQAALITPPTMPISPIITFKAGQCEVDVRLRSQASYRKSTH